MVVLGHIKNTESVISLQRATVWHTSMIQIYYLKIEAYKFDMSHSKASCVYPSIQDAIKVKNQCIFNGCCASKWHWPHAVILGKVGSPWGIFQEQGWRVLDGTRFLPWYLPINTILGKTGFGHPKWEKLGKHDLTLLTTSFINKRSNLALKYINTEHRDSFSAWVIVPK